MRSVWLCALLLCAVALRAEEPGPATSDPVGMVNWFVERDAEFFNLKKSGTEMQKKFKNEIQRDLDKLKDAAEVQSYLKRQTVILNWVTQHLVYIRYIKRGKYSPEEEAMVRKLEGNLASIPSKSQLLQAGYEVSDDTENWVAMKVKVASHYIQRKFAIKPKVPLPEDEVAVKNELFAEKK